MVIIFPRLKEGTSAVGAKKINLETIDFTDPGGYLTSFNCTLSDGETRVSLVKSC